MIYGVGCDILNLERVIRVYSKYGERFEDRVLSVAEKSDLYYDHTVSFSYKARYIAKRFSVKESFAKALGTGIGSRLSFREISLINDGSGRPVLVVDESVMLRFCINNYKVHVSLSDDANLIMSYVVLECFY